MSLYIIEVGKGKGSYKRRFSGENAAQASIIYNGINIANGYKKRVKENGKVIDRVLT